MYRRHPEPTNTYEGKYMHNKHVPLFAIDTTSASAKKGDEWREWFLLSSGCDGGAHQFGEEVG